MKLHIPYDIDQITIKPGQIFTVWLDREKDKCKRDTLQVELRVREDGTPEVFTHKDEIELKDFKDWKALNKANPRLITTYYKSNGEIKCLI